MGSQRIRCILPIFLVLAAYSLSQAADLSPGEILKHSDFARGNIKGIEWIIKIDATENGRQRTRKLNVRARGANTLAEFIAPSKVKGRKLLMLDRNMWFIKPGLRKPVPISPRQKLLGGASNGDIASTNYSGDYTIANVIEEQVDREPCYRYELVSNKNATYDRIHYWVSMKRHVGVKSHFFTINGKLFKTAEFEYDNSVVVENEHYPFVSKMIIRNAIMADNITSMTYHQVKVKPIADSTFNLNLLIR